MSIFGVTRHTTLIMTPPAPSSQHGFIAASSIQQSTVIIFSTPCNFWGIPTLHLVMGEELTNGDKRLLFSVRIKKDFTHQPSLLVGQPQLLLRIFDCEIITDLMTAATASVFLCFLFFCVFICLPIKSVAGTISSLHKLRLFLPSQVCHYPGQKGRDN